MAIRLEGIILAEGESHRMGYPKPLLEIDGKTFIEKIAAKMLDVVPRLVIVLGAHAGKIRPAIPRDSRIEIVENQNYSRGQLSSLKVGLGAVRSDCEGAIVHLADHPMGDCKSFKRIVYPSDQTRNPI